MRGTILGLALMLNACADLPRDPERTNQQVRESGTIRVGITFDAPPRAEAQAMLVRLQGETGAAAQFTDGDSEALLRDLADGKIDLVYGRFAMDSPWAKHVHLGKALNWRAEPPRHVAAPRFAYRSGENGWIMRAERAARP